MKPIDQQTPDSCMAACVATIIGCEFGEVPESFHAGKWDHAAQRYWLAARGWAMAEHKLLEGSMWPPTDGVLCIVSGKSPRGDHRHAVVAVSQYDTVEPFRVVHDPYPGHRGGLCIDGEIEIVTWVFRFQPAMNLGDA